MSEPKQTAVVPVVMNSEAAAKAVSDEQLRIAVELEENPRDKTIPGGKLLRNGVLVNAYGNEIHPDGKLKNPADAFNQTI